MERALEGTVAVKGAPQRVTRLLTTRPAELLSGQPSADQRVFVAELAVELSGGTSLVHEVDVTFGRRPDDGALGRFGGIGRADHSPVVGQGTIRKLYAESKGRNAVHGSDSDENAAREIGFFFPEHELAALWGEG